MLKDLFTRLGFASLLIPQVKTADVNSATFDLANKTGVVLIGYMGNSADTLSGSVYSEWEVEESDDDSSWNDVADADLTNYVDGANDGTFAKVDAPAEDSAIFAVGYKGKKRYVRVVYNITGTHTTGTPVAILAVYEQRVGPVNTAT